MKKLYPLFILFFALNGYAQDKPVVISGKMFDPLFEIVPLGKLDGWYFRTGKDTAWAKSDISLAGWQKLRPIDLSAKYAGKNGKVECWFRIRLKLDQFLKEKDFNINYGSFAPADIYVNGKRIGSIGNTGLYGHPYSEYYAEYVDPGFPITVKSGEQITLALHLVDTLAPLLPGKVKSNLTSGSDIIFLGSSDTYHLVQADYVNLIKSYTIWVSVCALLSLLFWLLVIQNRREKVFIYIAVWSTLNAFNNYSGLRTNEGVSSSAYVTFSVTSTFAFVLTLVLIPVIITEVFKRRLLTWIKIVLVIFAGFGLFAQFLPVSPGIPLSVITLFLICLSIYYIISSWKNLRGAQWSVVTGLLASLLTILAIVVAILLFPGQIYTDNGIGYYLSTTAILIFPLSLLVFVAMRFKEMLREVKQNADEVVRLSEEKKEEALNRQKLLEEEVNRQTAEIRASQARLIQSEKMASLGELTAGIAHEIQNPLNFVNNFSDVNQEMLVELKAESAKPKTERDEQLETELINDLIENEQKINHHGKRADAIVKGMLQHSRASSGQKEPTDLNALADEYFRLAYHGLRSKDKEFNAELVTHFDGKLPKINVIPQDIGRVLLNVINNAFYAVQQKAKTAGAGYKSEVAITTLAENWNVIVRVRDNGNGIPDAIKDKIMQPFFTTKPTGEGTGLGLSLSYDIVVKGHGGAIDIDTKEGQYSTFIITLPLS